MRCADWISQVKEIYKNDPMYLLTLTFHQADLPSLKKLDVFSFISRVQTVVFEGAERLVIEATHSGTSGSTAWLDGMSDPNVWTWNQPTSVRDVLLSDTVTAVNSLKLKEETADLVIDLSWSITGGDMNWTVTKTTRLESVQREGISAEEIFLNQKLRNIQTLKFDRSVLVNLSALAILTNLESLDLSLTNVVDVSALAKLTNLNWLTLRDTLVDNISALAELTKLKTLDQRRGRLFFD